MDISNPEAIRFVNEVFRPLAEKLRDLNAEMVEAIGQWDAGIGTIIGANATDSILDGREDEGVSRLTAADVAMLGVEVQYILARWDAATLAKIRKSCVRGIVIGNS